MLQILYLVAFGIIAFLTVRNLVGNLITMSREQRKVTKRKPRYIPHPELVDNEGNLTDEPLLVIRSTTLDDARSKLDQLYRESPDETAP